MKEAKSGWLLKTHFSVFCALRFCTQEMSVGKRRESTNDRAPDSKLQLSIVTERQTRHQMFHRSWPPWVLPSAHFRTFACGNLSAVGL